MHTDTKGGERSQSGQEERGRWPQDFDGSEVTVAWRSPVSDPV